MADTPQLSNTATPTTDAPLTEPSSSDTTNSQTQCLLFTLPQELRDIICDHVFGTGMVGGHIQLEVAHTLTPQSDLIITCRRIHEEATAIHQAAFKTYWENKTFKFILPLAHDLPALTSQCFKHMNYIVQHYRDGSVLAIRRNSERGGWKMFVFSDILSAPERLDGFSALAETWLRAINESRIKNKTLTAPST
jgi:hypothetical protein